jgi:hypothetical protein
MTAITDIRKAIAEHAGERITLVLGRSAERGLIAGMYQEDKLVTYGKFPSFEGIPIERVDLKEHPGWQVRRDA